MNEFTASNGIQIVRTNGGQTAYAASSPDADRDELAYLGFAEFAAFREFFLHERDEALGRWRWPEDPDWVVYGFDGNFHRVANERTGDSYSTSRSWEMAEYRGHGGTDAARAYFAAHPEPKPWHDAEPGELWAVTINGTEHRGLVRDDHHMVFRNGGAVARTSERITAGRRIWAES